MGTLKAPTDPDMSQHFAQKKQNKNILLQKQNKKLLALKPTFRQIHLIINQSNRKIFDMRSKSAGSLFITHTELKGMTEN